MTPLGQRGEAVLLEDVAAVEVTVVVKVIVDRGVRGGKFLQGFDVPELRHSTLSSPERHCQTNLSGPAKGAGLRRSGRQLTPLGEGGRTVLFEDVAAVEVAVVVEVVVD